MSLPPESEYETYEAAMRERYRLWVLYMTRNLEANKVTPWPDPPKTTPEPRPFCVWHVRPAGVPDNQPIPLPGWYGNEIEISGLKFHRKSGYSTLGKNPHRHGRLDWEATHLLATAYIGHSRQESDIHEKKLREMDSRLGNEALSQIPSVDGTNYPEHDPAHPRWVKVIRLPGNPKWGIPDTYACGTHYEGPVTLVDMCLHGTNRHATVEQALGLHQLTESCVSRILAQVDMVFLTKLDRARKIFLRENSS